LNIEKANTNRLSLTCKNRAPNKNPNENILKRKAMRLTEFAPMTHMICNYESVEHKVQLKDTLIGSFHLALK
jgi:hypothetical protein